VKVLADYDKERVTECWGNTCPQQISGPGNAIPPIIAKWERLGFAVKGGQIAENRSGWEELSLESILYSLMG